MAIEVVTKDDLEKFRTELLKDLRDLFQPATAKGVKPWLKNAELKELLNISSNTIQRLRIAGKLHSTKLGGTHYYRYEDVQRLLDSDAA
jgi:predicted peroxiredoxin